MRRFGVSSVRTDYIHWHHTCLLEYFRSNLGCNTMQHAANCQLTSLDWEILQSWILGVCMCACEICIYWMVHAQQPVMGCSDGNSIDCNTTQHAAPCCKTLHEWMFSSWNLHNSVFCLPPPRFVWESQCQRADSQVRTWYFQFEFQKKTRGTPWISRGR